MDGVRFDALVRVLGSMVERRGTARALMGGAIGAFGVATGHGAEDPRAALSLIRLLGWSLKIRHGQRCCCR